jgi:hypothetical protein
MGWSARSREERALLNPAFCAALLWHAARGCAATGTRPLAFEEAFLVLPFVLHRHTRMALPRDTRTSLAVWLDENALARGTIVSRAQGLVDYTKEAILFGTANGLLEIADMRLLAGGVWSRPVTRSLASTSAEVRECAKRAEFVGKWFALTGSESTVLAVLGVRP